MLGSFRSLFFVPGNNPRFLEKAKSMPADIVCFDLEDSVPDGQKDAARDMIRSALKERSAYGRAVCVRTNAPASGLVPDDLEAVVHKGIDGVVIPKVDGAAELGGIESALARLEAERDLPRIPVIPSIESARGVVNCYEIASSSERVEAVVFGVFDLLNDMNIDYTKQPPGAEYSRAKIPVDAAAAGVASIDAIWQDLHDETGLEVDCQIGRSLGYSGKSVIHPTQIAAVHGIFHPTAAEIRWAEAVRDAYRSSAGGGRGATTVGGHMVDEVHYKRALAVLDEAG